MRAMIVVMLAVLAAGPAFAEKRRPEPAPQTELAPGDLFAHAQQLIASANAGAYFEPLVGESLVSVRHMPSGLICRFDPAARRLAITIFPASAYGALPGEDVACNEISDNGRVTTLYATRYPDPVTAEQALAQIVSEMRQTHPNLRPYTPQVSMEGGDPAIASLTATFLVPRFQSNDVEHFTRASVAIVDGWVIMMRYTEPVGMEAELMAAATWMATLLASFDADK